MWKTVFLLLAATRRCNDLGSFFSWGRPQDFRRCVSVRWLHYIAVRSYHLSYVRSLADGDDNDARQRTRTTAIAPGFVLTPIGSCCIGNRRWHVDIRNLTYARPHHRGHFFDYCVTSHVNYFHIGNPDNAFIVIEFHCCSYHGRRWPICCRMLSATIAPTTRLLFMRLIILLYTLFVPVIRKRRYPLYRVQIIIIIVLFIIIVVLL